MILKRENLDGQGHDVLEKERAVNTKAVEEIIRIRKINSEEYEKAGALKFSTQRERFLGVGLGWYPVRVESCESIKV